jgi:hypothetical protein
MKFILSIEPDARDPDLDDVRPMRLEYHISTDASMDEYHIAYLAFLQGRTFFTEKLQKLLIEYECVCTPTEEGLARGLESSS